MIPNSSIRGNRPIKGSAASSGIQFEPRQNRGRGAIVVIGCDGSPHFFDTKHSAEAWLTSAAEICSAEDRISDLESQIRDASAFDEQVIPAESICQERAAGLPRNEMPPVTNRDRGCLG